MDSKKACHPELVEGRAQRPFFRPGTRLCMLATTHPDIATLVCPSLHLRWKEGRRKFCLFFQWPPIKAPLFKSPLYSEAEERVTSAAMSGES
jgi:hypothetical protein